MRLKTYLKCFGVFVVVFAIGILLLAFVNGNFNVSKWPYESRETVAVTTAICGCISSTLIIVFDIDGDD